MFHTSAVGLAMTATVELRRYGIAGRVGSLTAMCNSPIGALAGAPRLGGGQPSRSTSGFAPEIGRT
jgi:hypothetical protein